MKIMRIPAGVYAANCYIVYSETTKEGIIVDPGGDVEDILGFIERKGLKIDKIVLTHGHGDHLGGVIGMKKSLNADVMIHRDDHELLVDGDKNLSSTMPMGSVEIQADRLLEDGDIIEFGDLKAEVIHTPGHTKGGIALKIKDSIITGDTLFAGSIGRTDLPGGDYDTIIKSIKDRLMIFPDAVEVMPGHGGISTIGRERNTNPFLQ